MHTFECGVNIHYVTYPEKYVCEFSNQPIEKTVVPDHLSYACNSVPCTLSTRLYSFREYDCQVGVRPGTTVNVNTNKVYAANGQSIAEQARY